MFGVRRSFVGAVTIAVLATATVLVGSPSYASSALADADIARAVGQLDSVVADVMKATGVPGMAVAVVRSDSVLYAKGFGVRDVDTGAPVSTETVFQIASLSKPVSASVAAAGASRGVMAWDDPVQKYLPSFTLSDPYVGSHATIGDMYAMRTGLPGEAGDALELFGYNRAQVIERLRYLPLGPFRDTYAYANFSLTTGGQAVAAAAGKPWADISAEWIFEPLRMTKTSARYADFLAQPDRTALHVPVDGTWQSLYTRMPDAQAPAGGISSTILDMATWTRMELANGAFEGRQVVDPGALAAANTPQTRRSPVGDPAALPHFYGFGMNIDVDGTGRVLLSHSGAFLAGAGTTVSMLPGSDVGIVVLTNAMAGAAEAVALSFVDIAETGAVTRDWSALTGAILMAPYQADPRFDDAQRPASPRPAPRTAALLGTYANDFYGPVRVVRHGGGLAMVIGPAKVVMPLTHWNGSRFVATLGAGGWPIKTWVDFSGPRARATTLSFLLTDDPTKVLTRVS